MAAEKKADASKTPWTIHCTHCKTPLRMKNPALLGKRIDCPKCKKKVLVVTTDEDATLGYGVTAAPEPEPEPEPTDEELEAKELERQKVKRAKQWEQTKYIGGILWYLLLLGGVFGGVYYFVYVKGYAQRGSLQKSIDANVPTDDK